MKDCVEMTRYRVVRRRSRKKRKTLSTILALCLTWFLVGMMLCPLLDLVARAGDENAEGGIDSPSANMQELLWEEKWAVLLPEERLAVLEWVAMKEGEVLGLPFEIVVRVEEMEDKVLGRYEHRKHRITLREDLVRLGTARAALETLAHELYHAYQHCLVELYQESESYQKLLLFSQENVEAYCREFDHYQSGLDGDFSAYYSQQVEIDARNYAQNLCKAYDSLLGEMEG